MMISVRPRGKWGDAFELTLLSCRLLCVRWVRGGEEVANRCVYGQTPRPIGFVSSIDAAGVTNLAPFSCAMRGL